LFFDPYQPRVSVAVGGGEGGPSVVVELDGAGLSSLAGGCVDVVSVDDGGCSLSGGRDAVVSVAVVVCGCDGCGSRATDGVEYGGRSGCGTVTVRRAGGGCCDGIDGEDGAAGIDTDPLVGGNVDPSEPGAAVVVCVVGSVNAVVVSADVLVGGGVSPGALIVELAPVADPSCTTS